VTALNTGLKLMSFFVRKLTGIVIIILFIILAAFYAYDMANIYVVVNDGLSQRAQTVISRQDPSDLNRFFTLKYLNSDSLFYSDQYRDYLIQDFDYEMKIKKLWVWPWQSRTSVVVEEYIPESSWKFSVTDEMLERLTAAQTPADTQKPEGEQAEADAAGENGEEAKEVSLVIPKPQWQNGEKQVEFRKVDGQWKIDRIVFLRGIQPEKKKKS
jgi:hypothetical protein